MEKKNKTIIEIMKEEEEKKRKQKLKEEKDFVQKVIEEGNKKECYIDGIDVYNCKFSDITNNDVPCKSKEASGKFCRENANCRFKVWARNRKMVSSFANIKNLLINFIGVEQTQRLMETPNEQLTKDGLFFKALIGECENYVERK